MARVARIAAGLALVVAGLAVLPAGPASASSNIVAVWSDQSDYVQVSCSQPGTYTYGSRAIQVYNPCGDRVWLHYYDNSNGHVYTYCVNPGGGLAYDFPYPFTDLQLTNNPNPCWASNAFFTVAWLKNANPPLPPVWNDYGCQMGQSITVSGMWVYAAWNNESSTNQGPGTCDFRIWVHEYDNGTGQSACLDPGGTIPASLGYTSPVYWQVSETYNQAPCNAGGPPFPY